MPFAWVYGLITNIKNGEGISGATITLYDPSLGQNARTKVSFPDGAYEYVYMPGNFDVTYDADGYYPETVENIRLANMTFTLCDVALRPYNGARAVRRERDEPQTEAQPVSPHAYLSRALKLDKTRTSSTDKAQPVSRRTRTLRVPRRIKDPKARKVLQLILNYCTETRAKEIQKHLRTAIITEHDPSKKHI